MKQISVFSIGFRPLFLVAGWFAVIAILWWSLYWGQFLIPSLTSFFNLWQPYGGAIWWHGHEMCVWFYDGNHRRLPVNRGSKLDGSGHY